MGCPKLTYFENLPTLKVAYSNNLEVQKPAREVFNFNRKSSAGTYRYGFNGYEKDNEVKGNGNSYDFGARMYDNRLGRFFATDPMMKHIPFHTPYQFAGNRPILMMDFNGMFGWPKTSEWHYSDVKKFGQFVTTEIAKMKASAIEKGLKVGEECNSDDYPDVCFDCADFAMSLLIDYASKNGKEISITLVDGTVINSSTSTNVKISGINGIVKINGIEDFDETAKSFAKARSILNDMSKVGIDEVRKGDITNTGDHVQVVTGDGFNEDGVISIEQASDPPMVPYESAATSMYPKQFKRWNVLDIKKPAELTRVSNKAMKPIAVESNKDTPKFQ